MQTWIITVESDGFNKAYKVRASNEKQAIELLHAKKITENWIKENKEEIEVEEEK